MQVGDYAESLSSSNLTKVAESSFSVDSAEAALPERPDWTPEMLSGFAADMLLMPLGGLGADRCSPSLQSMRHFYLSKDMLLFVASMLPRLRMPLQQAGS